VSARREVRKHESHACVALAEAALAAAHAAVPAVNAVVTTTQEDVENAHAARAETEVDAVAPEFPPTIALLLEAGNERLHFHLLARETRGTGCDGDASRLEGDEVRKKEGRLALREAERSTEVEERGLLGVC